MVRVMSRARRHVRTCRRTVACAASLTVAVLGIAAPLAQQPVEPGDPLPGITAAEFEEFRLGLEDFLEVETAEEGLGPAYNATSCAGCHSVPAVGGIAPVTTVRAGIRGSDGSFRDFDSARGSLFQLFSVRPTAVSRSYLPTRTSSRAVCRSHCSVPGWSKRFRIRPSWRSRTRSTSMATGSAVVPRW